MKKLSLPAVNFATALNEAISGIGDVSQRQTYQSAFLDAHAIETHYADCATAATLHAQPRVTTLDDPIIIAHLRKSDLMRLYTQYFVPKDKAARRIYEDIKVTANGKCPLCGGVGHVRTLDHYLPKSNFPLYSVMPANLIPCCRDCNSEKLNAFAGAMKDQTLHPYFDHDRFFDDKWIYANVIQSSPPVLEYFVRPPESWDSSHKSRVKAHFDDYGLADKFSVEAAADLPETIQTRRTSMVMSSPQEFSNYLSEKSRTLSFPVNNWRRVMFAALAADEWFCEQEFLESRDN
ncbi:5-methylcytosine-specific restriction endonuclease McrA [Bosea sp. BE125]|uniref:HNH endonuclease n=1 Tax=Bosea sp. BE125 TaxID=2817909 RepID=UPI00286658CA|nr:HNH endonuclease signature motif containing protein [Bosea sp. BE125]MDR6869561.1 5-methylcytosine-specific restriction endonuclease McrA [Bosea sp. BE125]